jgi:flavocytochrome c
MEVFLDHQPEIFDVIVIGSGFAGLAAAIEAREAGASVVVLEKMRAVGGNSVISDGGVAAAGTDLQKKYGFKDSPELMYADMMKAGLGLNSPELVRKVAEGSKEAFKWSVNYLGVKYMDRVDHFGGHSVHRCYTAEGRTGAAIIRKEVDKLRELGVEIRLGTAFKSFILDADGRVTGVRAREGFRYNDPEAGTDVEITADKAVVLATGGFGADVNFRVRQDPRLTSEIDTTNTPHATAEALIEALDLGAEPVDLSQIQLGPWTSPDEKGFGDGPVFADYIAFLYGLAVDPETGRRFVNELGDRKVVSDAILGVGHACIGIADDAAVKAQGWDISRALKKGVVRKFDTIKNLAAAYDIPLNELEGTIKRFNGFVKKGEDADFGKPILPDAAPVAKPPFYSMRLWPKVHFTMGGVKIDTRARVIDVNGNPIPGLYAAGEVTGGVHGACRLGSCAITECLVMGRIAGRETAGKNKVQG